MDRTKYMAMMIRTSCQPGNNPETTAANMRDKDPRHLYILNSLHGAYIRYPVEGTRRDFVSQDAMRNGSSMLREAGRMILQPGG